MGGFSNQSKSGCETFSREPLASADCDAGYSWFVVHARQRLAANLRCLAPSEQRLQPARDRVSILVAPFLVIEPAQPVRRPQNDSALVQPPTDLFFLHR